MLPVFTLRQADGGTTTFVGGALDQPVGAGRAETIDALLDDYVPRLENYVGSSPDQFSFPISDRFGKPMLSSAASVVSSPSFREVEEAAA